MPSQGTQASTQVPALNLQKRDRFLGPLKSFRRTFLPRPETATTAQVADSTLSLSTNVYAALFPPPMVLHADTNSPSTRGNTESVGAKGLAGFKQALQVVERVSDVFPPLKAAAAGLLVILDHVDVRNFDRFWALSHSIKIENCSCAGRL